MNQTHYMPLRISQYIWETEWKTINNVKCDKYDRNFQIGVEAQRLNAWRFMYSFIHLISTDMSSCFVPIPLLGVGVQLRTFLELLFFWGS